MSQLANRLERDLRDIAAGADPSPAAWESILARLDDEAAPGVASVFALAPDRPKRPVWPAVAAAALLVIGSIAVLMRAGDDESISTADFPDLTTTFVSPRNGYSVKYFDRGEGSVIPAEQLWGFELAVDDAFDVVETGVSAVFKGTSVRFPYDGACLNTEDEPSPCGSIDEQVDEYLSDYLPGGCGVPRSRQAETAIDGQSGRVAECQNHIEATVLTGRRLYLFTLAHARSDARAVFDAFLATVELTPETAVDFPGLTTTFHSPTYGFSFGYLDRGGLDPATEGWDPDNQPLRAIGQDPRFDAVETGLGAYFEAASTPIRDGLSIDDWVDQYVTPRAAGHCGVPRSRQAEITIDGHSGRVAECQDQIEVTVVAGERLYLFTLYASSRDAREMLDAWIATIDLTPETAVVP